MEPKDIARFMSKVEKTDNCWEWQAQSTTGKGYGTFWLNNKMNVAHRISYEIFVGYVPHGKVLDHLCRNRACVNPEHLDVVTQKINCIRGNTGKHEADKTHCPQGHLYYDHIREKRSGRVCGRICLPCKADSSRRYRAKMRVWKK